MKTVPLIILLTFGIRTAGLGQCVKQGTVVSRVEYNTLAIAQTIKGTWYLNKWTTYHTLIFNDQTVYVDNNIDTVFTVKYLVTQDSLILWVGQPTKQIKSKIVSLSKDKLVLQGIGEVKELRTYTRTKSKFEN